MVTAQTLPAPGGAVQAAPKKSMQAVLAGQQQRQATRTILQTSSCPQIMRRTETPWSFADFTVLRMLGEGQMSSVVQCLCNQSGLPVAIKMYHKDRMNHLNVKQVGREIEIHASLQHPGVVQLYAAFEDADGIYLVEELAPKGDLFGELGRKGGYMQEGHVVKNVLHPFLRALAYLHGQGVLHRDIKPENILLGEVGQVLIGDLGLAINVVRERPVSRVGTLDYMAPEIVRLPLPTQAPGPLDANTAERPPSYGPPVDVWCVGILAYELLIGGPPFETDSRDETYTRIMKMQPYLPSHLSQNAKDFIAQCLRKEASQRPTVMQLLRHPWVKVYEPAISMRTLDVALPHPVLDSQSSTPPGSPLASLAAAQQHSFASNTSSDTLTVLPSPASAPCLLSGSAQQSGGSAHSRGLPLGARLPGLPGSGYLAGGLKAAKEADRHPKVNSFTTLSALANSPEAKKKGGSPECSPGSSPHNNKEAGGGHSGHSMGSRLAASSSGSLINVTAAAASWGAQGSTAGSLARESIQAAAAAAGSPGFQSDALVMAARLTGDAAAGKLPAAYAATDGDKGFDHAHAEAGLIPAVMPAGSTLDAAAAGNSPKGSPRSSKEGHSYFSKIKSRLSSMGKALIPGSRRTGSSTGEHVAAEAEQAAAPVIGAIQLA